MSAKHMGQVFDLALSHSQAWVLLAMADHADHLGERIWPSVALLAWKTGYCERQIQTILGQLRSLGVIAFVQKATGRPGQANHYRLTLERGPFKPPFRLDDQEDETGAVSAPLPQPDLETGAVSGETGAVSVQTGAVATAPESPSRTVIENRGDATPPSPPPPVFIAEHEESEPADDPEDLWNAPVSKTDAYTPKQLQLLRFAERRGATIEHPSLGDLRGEWLHDLESPGLTAEEAEQALRDAGPNCLPSGFRRFAPSAQERQDRADAIERRRRDSEYLVSVERQRNEWEAHCARVLAARATA